MYISLYEISEKVCIVIEPKMDVNKLYIVKSGVDWFMLGTLTSV